VSRGDRLSTREYLRLTPDQRKAVDCLRYSNPSPAARGAAKTILGWKRTAEETTAYANRLLEDGMTLSAVAGKLGVGTDHLRRLLKKGQSLSEQVCNPSTHAEKSGLTDRTQVVTHPSTREGPVYGSDPFSYDFAAALRRAT